MTDQQHHDRPRPPVTTVWGLIVDTIIAVTGVVDLVVRMTG